MVNRPLRIRLAVREKLCRLRLCPVRLHRGNLGIPGALDAGNAFYITTGRVTEVCLGIIVAATVNHIILPSSLGPQLWQAVIGGSQAIANYALALFERRGDSAPSRTKLLGQAIAIENLRGFGDIRGLRDPRPQRPASVSGHGFDRRHLRCATPRPAARRSGGTRAGQNGARRCHCRRDCCDQGMARHRDRRGRL